MIARIQKWGNSLALRIPKSYALETGLDQNTEVEVLLKKDRIIISPVRPKLTLNDLLAKVTDENLHAETFTGPPAGNEII